MIIAGVEEAGRGPVIGPMVMAICALDENYLNKISPLVKDSKLLSRKQREDLFEHIKEVCDYKIIILGPAEIDDALNDPGMNLNKLEGKTSALLINSVKAGKVILDCPSNNVNAYKDYVKSMVKDKDVKIIAEHKADLNYKIVAAASILAKVTRDWEVDKLKKKAGEDFGSGYPSDPLTKAFIEKNWDKHDFFRKTWSTYKKIAERNKQKGLKDF